MFKIVASFIITLFAFIYVRVSIINTRGNTCMTASFHTEGKFGSVRLV